MKRPLVTLAVGFAAALAAGCGSGDTIAQPPPETPTPVPAPSEDTEASPKVVEPVPAENAKKRPWNEAKPEAGGKKLRVEWWAGVEPCSVLGKVDVAETAKKVQVTLYEGPAKGQADAICTQQAVLKATIVDLEKPLGKRKVVDGAK